MRAVQARLRNCHQINVSSGCSVGSTALWKDTLLTGIPELHPLGQALGTEALGIDRSKPLVEETVAWIKRAFAEHPVLVFRDQNIGAAELAAFGHRFSRPRPHSLVDYRVSMVSRTDFTENIARLVIVLTRDEVSYASFHTKGPTISWWDRFAP
jgi:Taurine catabolism dioxygenase TauD, TfdA family